MMRGEKRMEEYWQEGIDSKAFLVELLYCMPYMLLLGVAGAVIGSGLYLIIMTVFSGPQIYQAETEYYIDFAEGRLEAKDYYNDATWNDVMATDLILGNTMSILGEEYDRNEIKDMITADILSDVRYLTITVEGENEALVAAVSDVTKISLENFANGKDEFDSIYQIEDNGVVAKTVKLFTWRAALLGSVLGVIAMLVKVSLEFGVGDRFYTRKDILKYLNLPALGILYKNGKAVCNIEEMNLDNNLSYIIDKSGDQCGKKEDISNNAKIVVLGFTDADAMQDIKGQIKQNIEIISMAEEINSDSYEKIRQAQIAILAVPFGVSVRRKIEERIENLEIQDCHITGAILTGCSRGWMKLYFGRY